MPPPLKISVLRPAAFIASKVRAFSSMFSERPLLARGEPVDVLRAAVVRQHAAQLQVRQPIDQLRQRQRAVAGGDAAARADGDVDHDVSGHARFLCRG